MNKVEVVARPLQRHSEPATIPAYDGARKIWAESFGYTELKFGDPFVVEFHPRTNSREDRDEAWAMAIDFYRAATRSEQFVTEFEQDDSFRVIVRQVGSLQDKIKGQLRSALRQAYG